MVLLLLLAIFGGIVLEVWVAIRVADLIGTGPTVLLLLVSTILGGQVLRRGAPQRWQRVAEASRTGEKLGKHVLDAGLIVVAGVLLLVPGLISGALGLLLLLPPVRAVVRPLLAALVLRRVTLPVMVGARSAQWAAGRARPANRPGAPGDIEGTATDRSAAGVDPTPPAIDIEGTATDRTRSRADATPPVIEHPRDDPR